jgi:hypothetical protein
LQELVKMRLLSSSREKRLLKQLKSMWFGDRTLSHARAMVLAVIPDRAQEVDKTLTEFDRFRLKSHDLTNFLREQPWQS